ncbi:MAG: adenylate/guanylate cyclase domain-containing protein [Desulfamplus sp.]|nr:adenylate/guanylate cyclase domain-containing protein [Desulfamplus sp.]
MKPEDVVILLNRFFSHMIPIIFKHKGTLDKLLGDGIMAVFGTPIEDSESCLNAVRAALEMFTVLHNLNKNLIKQDVNTPDLKNTPEIKNSPEFQNLSELKTSPELKNTPEIKKSFEMKSHIEMGSGIEMRKNFEMRKNIEIKKGLEMSIGINYGELVSGFMGSEQHLNYTVVGDVVNAAQRLQSLAGCNEIFLSGIVYDNICNHLESLDNLVDAVRLDDVKLKGKENITSLYRLIPILK